VCVCTYYIHIYIYIGVLSDDEVLVHKGYSFPIVMKSCRMIDFDGQGTETMPQTKFKLKSLLFLKKKTCVLNVRETKSPKKQM